jgi:polyhydroxybutyrate depolymerase
LNVLHKHILLKCAGIVALFLACPAYGDDVAADSERTLQMDGIERSYLVHIPPGASERHSIPLVLVLHGGAGTAVLVAKQTGFREQADSANFIVAFPNGTDRPRPLMNLLGKPGFLTWNAGGCCGYAMDHLINDVGFLRGLVTELERSYPIDRRRIYAAGISNGGMMAYRLGCEASDIFAAIGVVSGVLVTQPCLPSAPLSVIDFHGTDDRYVPLTGGVGPKSLIGTEFPPVRDSISFWVGIDACHAPQEAQIAQGVTAFEYPKCRAGTAVTFNLIQGGGHAWPGGDRISLILDPPSTTVNATAVIWRFFAAHPKE